MEIIKGRRHVYIVSVREENDAFDLAGYEAELVVCRGVGSEPTLKKKRYSRAPKFWQCGIYFAPGRSC